MAAFQIENLYDLDPASLNQVLGALEGAARKAIGVPIAIDCTIVRFVDVAHSLLEEFAPDEPRDQECLPVDKLTQLFEAHALYRVGNEIKPEDFATFVHKDTEETQHPDFDRDLLPLLPPPLPLPLPAPHTQPTQPTQPTRQPALTESQRFRRRCYGADSACPPDALRQLVDKFFIVVLGSARERALYLDLASKLAAQYGAYSPCNVAVLLVDFTSKDHPLDVVISMAYRIRQNSLSSVNCNNSAQTE